MKKHAKTLVSVVVALVIVALSFVGYKPRGVYDAAVEAMRQGDYEMARSHLERLDTRDANELLGELYFVPNKVITTYTDGATQTQNYAYNRKGCLVKVELLDNELPVTTTAYTYTPEGQMLTMDLTLANELRPQTSVECYYDEFGNQTCFRTYGDEGLFYQTQYTYDGAGRCVSSFYVNGTGEWEETEFVYDEGGLLLSQKKTTDDEGVWENHHYTYDEDGQLKTHRKTTQEGKTVTNYRPDGTCRSVVFTSADGERETRRYTYNEQGLLTEMVDSSGRKVVYHYNKSGQLTSSHEQVSAEEWVETLLEYEEGHLVKRMVNDSDREVYTEVYKYNKKGLCTSHQYKNDTTGAWYKYTYAYDRHGNIEQEIYEAEVGSYERTIKWKTRHYPNGMPQMIQNLTEEYLFDADRNH